MGSSETRSQPVEQLRVWMAELSDLRDAAAVLDWDQQTMMPRRGARNRAEVLATLERLTHDKFVSAQTGQLIDAAEAALNGTSPDSDEARLVRVSRRRWEKARRVPTELAGEMAKADSIGQDAWIRARAENDFPAFAPYLERNLALAREYVACFEGFDCAYDVLLDDYEPDMKSAHVKRLFDELKAELVPLIASISEQESSIDASCLHARFPLEEQRRLVEWTVRRMGFDPEGWRLDDAVHPFATSFGSQDVRITTRWDEMYFPMSLYGAMHECGHGLYEAGVGGSLQRSPLARLESLSLHESQSRLWENMVGRGRAFCTPLAPVIAEVSGGRIAPDEETLFRAVNRVLPSFIRVEADEATYGLHIVLRFELEQELVEDRLKVADLPEAWNARYKEYLNLDVPDDRRGVLQDVHWSSGLIGYFPTYALGNLIAGQLWERVHGDIPDLEDQLRAAELGGLREWLRENVHRHGSKFPTTELLSRVVGGPIAVGPFLAYLKEKLSGVYGLEL
ncbi:MAG TPA: carboxypeptidase M32 [Solirubrobacteraceae bacterium]|nr:carboxypeptidase M32 [Solirubrobacteraceae bacterium]